MTPRRQNANGLTASASCSTSVHRRRVRRFCRASSGATATTCVRRASHRRPEPWGPLPGPVTTFEEWKYNPKDPRPDWTGSWDLLAGLATSSSARTTIISDEHLAALTPEQVTRAAESLRSREVHVVYTTRNLARLLPSEHQEYVKHRSPLTYEEWTNKIFNDRSRGPGKWFWSVHDPVDVVRRCSDGSCPRERPRVDASVARGTERRAVAAILCRRRGRSKRCH